MVLQCVLHGILIITWEQLNDKSATASNVIAWFILCYSFVLQVLLTVSGCTSCCYIPNNTLTFYGYCYLNQQNLRALINKYSLHDTVKTRSWRWVG